jgi:hypothetical protein
MAMLESQLVSGQVRTRTLASSVSSGSYLSDLVYLWIGADRGHKEEVPGTVHSIVFKALEASFFTSQYLLSGWEGLAKWATKLWSDIFSEGRGGWKARRSIIFQHLEYTLRPVKMGLESYKWMISCTYQTFFQCTYRAEAKKNSYLSKSAWIGVLERKGKELISPINIRHYPQTHTVFRCCQKLSFHPVTKKLKHSDRESYLDIVVVSLFLCLYCQATRWSEAA